MSANPDLPIVNVGEQRSEKTFRFRLAAALVVPFLNIIARYRWVDVDKMPHQGAFILAPNHYTNLDPLVVAYALWKNKRVPRFLAKASLFTVPVLGWMLKALGQIPVDRPGVATSASTESISAASNIAKSGKAVIVYPEGTLTREPDLWPMRGKTGAVRLALQQDIPVIPLVHWGAAEVMPRYKNSLHIFPRKTITIKFGDPVDLSEYRGRPVDTASLNAATEKVMVAITELLETVRGGEAPIERWDPRQHNQTETGKF
jgi:1-acyl-sn-glycerol-3-phosphate acyltransferase